MNDSSLGELFLKGGFIMWPLFGMSLLAVVLIFERALYFIPRRYRVARSLEGIRAGVQQGSIGASRNPLLQLAGAYLDGLSGGAEHVRNVTSREANRLLNRHEQGLRLLATIGNIAPLIGLLGTVWGMVQAFANIAVLGDAVRPADLAAGIWTGLLTTVAGLVVAIPAIAMTRFYEARVDHLAHDLNEVVSHLDEWTRKEGAQSGEASRKAGP